MPTVPYHDFLIERLRDPDHAGVYLTLCAEESEDVFLLGLRQVAEALGGVSLLAEKTGLNRESLYKLLSENGNPRLSSLGAIIEAFGLKMSFEPKQAPDAA